ncbi:resuscitation-promoting factor [Lentibacillus halophilus]|uniref:Resuscitation-promoting factor n=1 Tax=Lentibacillus halophilus TaxID=295065 RepID=A0ABP3J1V8_9BACI
MKKLTASIAAGIIMAGAVWTSVSAATYNDEEDNNLWAMTKDHNTTINKLADSNELNSTTIQPKQTSPLRETYQVEKDDTLIGIGNKYDVSVENLKKWNDLDSQLIAVGQELDIREAIRREDDSTSASDNHDTQAESDQDKLNKSAVHKVAAKTTESNEQSSNQNPQGKTITVSATAYTADCDGCSGVTSTGVNLNANPNAKVIAVDPDVIPLGSKVHVEGYGYATAADVGGAIQGNKIDVHVPTKNKAYNWGVRTVDVTIVN